MLLATSLLSHTINAIPASKKTESGTATDLTRMDLGFEPLEETVQDLLNELAFIQALGPQGLHFTSSSSGSSLPITITSSSSSPQSAGAPPAADPGFDVLAITSQTPDHIWRNLLCSALFIAAAAYVSMALFCSTAIIQHSNAPMDTIAATQTPTDFTGRVLDYVCTAAKSCLGACQAFAALLRLQGLGHGSGHTTSCKSCQAYPASSFLDKAATFLWVCCALYWAPLIIQLSSKVIAPLIRELLMDVTSWVTISSGLQISSWVVGRISLRHAWQLPLAHVLLFRCGLINPVLHTYYSVWASMWLTVYMVGYLCYVRRCETADSDELLCCEHVSPQVVPTCESTVPALAAAAAAGALHGRLSSAGEGVFVEVFMNMPGHMVGGKGDGKSAVTPPSVAPSAEGLMFGTGMQV